MAKRNHNKRNFLSTLGLLSSFIGMAGLVLSIISLVPLNGYNIYTTIITIINLFQHELANQGGGEGQQDWKHIHFSQDASLHFIFLFGSCLSSMFEIVLTLIACCRHQVENHHQQQQVEEAQGSGNKKLLLSQRQQRRYYNRNSWFLRFTCLTLLLQITFSLFGTHIIYKIKSDVELIPIEIQHNTFISCAILWINYLLLTLFAFILLFASFCILMGAYQHHYKQESRQEQQDQEIDETSPLMAIVV